MKTLELKNGFVEVQEAGKLIKTLGNGSVISADLNHEETLVLMTYQKGLVEVRAVEGKHISNIGNGDAINAKWLGNHVTVINEKGRADIRKMNNIRPRSL